MGTFEVGSSRNLGTLVVESRAGKGVDEGGMMRPFLPRYSGGYKGDI